MRKASIFTAVPSAKAVAGGTAHDLIGIQAIVAADGALHIRVVALGLLPDAVALEHIIGRMRLVTRSHRPRNHFKILHVRLNDDACVRRVRAPLISTRCATKHAAAILPQQLQDGLNSPPKELGPRALNHTNSENQLLLHDYVLDDLVRLAGIAAEQLQTDHPVVLLELVQLELAEKQLGGSEHVCPELTRVCADGRDQDLAERDVGELLP